MYLEDEYQIYNFSLCYHCCEVICSACMVALKAETMISRILQGDGQNIYIGGAALTNKIVLGGQSRVKCKSSHC